MSSKCSKCGENAVITREYEGRSLCADHFKRSVERQFKKTIRTYNLLDSEDHVAVGLSGGKDSAVLLKLLHQVFGERPDINLSAIAVDEGIEGYRQESIDEAKKLTSKFDVDLEIVRFEDEYEISIDDLAGEQERPPCTVCGVLRRSLLNETARKLGADKLAIGHNLDDQAQTILMNHLRGDTSKLMRTGFRNDYLENQNLVTRIKPLGEIPEREVALYSKLEELGVVDECPHVDNSLIRPKVKKFLNNIQETMPGVKHSLVAQGERIAKNMDAELEKPELSPCKRCGEPTSQKICRKCKFLEDVKQ